MAADGGGRKSGDPILSIEPPLRFKEALYKGLETGAPIVGGMLLVFLSGLFVTGMCVNIETRHAVLNDKCTRWCDAHMEDWETVDQLNECYKKCADSWDE